MSMNKDDIDFHDSGQDDVLFDKTDGQTHTFTNFPTSAVSDEEEGGEEDKSQLLKDKKSPSFWTFEYYQQFFDVDTNQVFNRVLGSMTPLPNRNYLKSHIRPKPDLYGPFWICTTLVFTTAIAGNLANYLTLGGQDYTWRYDFHKVTIAASAIFSYWWLIPAMLYGVLWYRKSEAGYTFMEILCLYGYSLAIYIPISILWVINVTWLRWLLVIAGAITSGGVLVITFWPAVREDTKHIAYAIISLVFLFHLLLAAGFVLYFFHVPPITPATPAAAVQTTTKPVIPPNPPAEQQQQQQQQQQQVQQQQPQQHNQQQVQKQQQDGSAKQAPPQSQALVDPGSKNSNIDTKVPTDKQLPASGGDKLAAPQNAAQDKIATQKPVGNNLAAQNAAQDKIATQKPAGDNLAAQQAGNAGKVVKKKADIDTKDESDLSNVGALKKGKENIQNVNL